MLMMAALLCDASNPWKTEATVELATLEWVS